DDLADAKRPAQATQSGRSPRLARVPALARRPWPRHVQEIKTAVDQAGPWPHFQFTSGKFAMLTRSFLLFAMFVVSVRCASAADNPQADQSKPVLFASDDENMGWQHNLKLTLVSPDKPPASPVVRCGPKGSPDYGHAILYGTVIHTDGKFRMWYLGM